MSRCSPPCFSTPSIINQYHPQANKKKGTGKEERTKRDEKRKKGKKGRKKKGRKKGKERTTNKGGH
jgi:hypothetical protein